MADTRVEAMTLTTRGRFLADQLQAAWEAGRDAPSLMQLFSEIAGPDRVSHLERPLLKQCVAITLASAGIDIGRINAWLRE